MEHSTLPNTVNQSVLRDESLVKPGPNAQFFVWLVVLGLPALVLFMIYSKTVDSRETSVLPPATHHQAPAHH